jgi:hypothetical protein
MARGDGGMYLLETIFALDDDIRVHRLGGRRAFKIVP